MFLILYVRPLWGSNPLPLHYKCSTHPNVLSGLMRAFMVTKNNILLFLFYHDSILLSLYILYQYFISKFFF